MTDQHWNRLKERANAGDPEAQWEVGSWFEDGLTGPNNVVLVPPDPRAAFRWFRRSALAGNPTAQNHLGVCFSDGRGTKRDDAEALRWFRRALRQGDLCAPNNIACVYRDRGNNRRAMFWYGRAVAQGDGDALVEVGRGYYEGVGVRRDPKNAVRCFQRAIRSIRSSSISQSSREAAMFYLGIAFHEGRGVRQSDARALKWLSRANHDDDFPEARKLIERIMRKGS